MLLFRMSRQRVQPESRANRNQLDQILEEGKYLLHFAVEAGMEVEPHVAAHIIEGARRGPLVWDSPQAGELVAAISKLAAKLHPVTAETLRACREDADDAIRGYKKIVYWLAGLIVPLSMISFIYTSLSNTITAQLKIANDLAVALHQEVDSSATSSTQGPLPGSVTQLQQFAVAMRAATADMLRANGVTVEIEGDDLIVHGKANVAGGGEVATHMDHRIAMSALMMGLASDNPVRIDDSAFIATSFPGFVELMRSLGADLT